jgi:hypothetical protein
MASEMASPSDSNSNIRSITHQHHAPSNQKMAIDQGKSKASPLFDLLLNENAF